MRGKKEEGRRKLEICDLEIGMERKKPVLWSPGDVRFRIW